MLNKGDLLCFSTVGDHTLLVVERDRTTVICRHLLLYLRDSEGGWWWMDPRHSYHKTKMFHDEGESELDLEEAYRYVGSIFGVDNSVLYWEGDMSKTAERYRKELGKKFK